MEQEFRTLHPPHDRRFDDNFFFALCQANELVILERDARGSILLNSLHDAKTSQFNATLIGEVGIWNRQTQLGVTFYSCTGFTLPNSAVRSPDASWIAKERWDELTDEERQGDVLPNFSITLPL